MTLHQERAYIRHPIDIPLEVHPSTETCHAGAIRNLSPGGLAFAAAEPYQLGSDVTLVIRCCPNALEVHGQVVWCEAKESGFEVGIAFYSPTDAYQVRMVEQVCQIEQYRRDALLRDGREMTQEEAAREWISLYADQFAQSGWYDE